MNTGRGYERVSVCCHREIGQTDTIVICPDDLQRAGDAIEKPSVTKEISSLI